MKKLIILMLLPFIVGSNEGEYVEYFKGQKLDAPLRELSIIISEEGYYPKNISVFKGEKVRLFVTTTLESQGCLVMPSKELFLSANKGSISEKLIYFNKLGDHEFYCPTKKIKGKITVLERPSDKIRRMRELASQKDAVKIWYPKEE